MSLVSWYPLIKDFKDQGLAGEDLTYRNSSTTITWTDGKIGNAATFSGNAATLQRPLFTQNNNFSACIWFYITEATSTRQHIFSNGRDVSNDGWGIDVNASLQVRWQCGSYVINPSSSTQIEAGKWYHAAIVCNNAVANFYLNGERIGGGNVTTLPLYVQGGNFCNLGVTSYMGTSYSYPLKGKVNDFRIYDHALSVKEVKELAKGMIMHLPLSWGGNPNMIKNSYTWMNKNLGSASGSSTHSNRKVYWDETAPSPWVYTDDLVSNADTTKVSGDWFAYSAQGVALTDLTENEYYTYSFWARTTTGNNTGLSAGSICESQTKVSDSGFGALTSTWRKHTVTFKFTRTDKLTCCFYCSVPTGTTVNFQICGFKLEKGQKATPYIPNVEETAYINDSYSTKYLQDCSGYNYIVSGYGSNNTSCISPKGSSGTNCGSGSCIVLGKTCKIQYPMSFAFWFNTSNLQNNSNRLISCTEGGGWNVELNGNYLCWTTGTGTSSNAYKYCISTKTYTELQGAWHHIVCTYDGLKSQMYIDGTLNKETTHFTTETPLYYNANNGVFLAAEAGGSATNPGTTYTTETKLADFRMYATVISADDVKELYQVGMQIDKSGNIYCNELVEE